MASSFELVGASELAAKLDRLPDRIADKIIRSMLLEAARNLRDDFKARAPIQADASGGHPPGTGLAALDATPGRDRGRDRIEAHTVLRPEGFFLTYVEFGTRHAPPYPFMRPALDSNAAAILEGMVDYGRERLAAVVKA